MGETYHMTEYDGQGIVIFQTILTAVNLKQACRLSEMRAKKYGSRLQVSYGNVVAIKASSSNWNIFQ
jgi:hypothetical protein